jgi:hypothetical protein
LEEALLSEVAPVVRTDRLAVGLPHLPFALCPYNVGANAWRARVRQSLTCLPWPPCRARLTDSGVRMLLRGGGPRLETLSLSFCHHITDASKEGRIARARTRAGWGAPTLRQKSKAHRRRHPLAALARRYRSSCCQLPRAVAAARGARAGDVARSGARAARWAAGAHAYPCAWLGVVSSAKRALHPRAHRDAAPAPPLHRWLQRSAPAGACRPDRGAAPAQPCSCSLVAEGLTDLPSAARIAAMLHASFFCSCLRGTRSFTGRRLHWLCASLAHCFVSTLRRLRVFRMWRGAH